jgi:hypothetical protein
MLEMVFEPKVGVFWRWVSRDPLLSAKIFLLGGLAFEAADIVGDMKCFVDVVVSGFFGFCTFKLLP